MKSHQENFIQTVFSVYIYIYYNIFTNFNAKIQDNSYFNI